MLHRNIILRRIKIYTICRRYILGTSREIPLPAVIDLKITFFQTSQPPVYQKYAYRKRSLSLIPPKRERDIVSSAVKGCPPE